MRYYTFYTNDKDGNTLSEKGIRYEARYEYNAQNRMVFSQVTSHVEKTHVVSFYTYNALGRQILTASVTGETIRTLYDGRSFEVIREGEAYRDGSMTTRNAPWEPASNALSNQATGERYRWVGEGGDGGRTRSTLEEEYTVTSIRYGARGVTLYGKGEAVAKSSSTGSRSMYLGKDIMGSVRSMTVETGALEDRYEYDAFGQPYKGDLSKAMNLGYTGKPYDTTTGLYNYGYRDYKPQAARFTTVDPIRDGNNWFAYVNNDPLNWVDPWGLNAEDTQTYGVITVGLSVEATFGIGISVSIGLTFESNENGGITGGLYTSASLNFGLPSYGVGVTVSYTSNTQTASDLNGLSSSYTLNTPIGSLTIASDVSGGLDPSSGVSGTLALTPGNLGISASLSGTKTGTKKNGIMEIGFAH